MFTRKAFPEDWAMIQHDLALDYGNRLRGERADHTLQPTALVNEAYLRLVDQNRVRWRNRAHFFAIAVRLMRRVLVDHARRQRAVKRGRAFKQVTLSEAVSPLPELTLDLIALDDALAALAEFDPDLARLVEVRFFGGLTIEETAEALDISPATVKREWATARAWLHRRLEPPRAEPQ